MAVDPAVQAKLDDAETASGNPKYRVVAVVGQTQVEWVSGSKADLRDTVAVAVNKASFKSCQINTIRNG